MQRSPTPFIHNQLTPSPNHFTTHSPSILSFPCTINTHTHTHISIWSMERSSSRRDARTGNNDDLQNSESDGKGSKDVGEMETIERIFETKEVPPWRRQLTLRAFVVSFILGILFTFIVMKLNLTTGIIPSLNVSAGLLGFFFVKTWTKFLNKSGMLKQPFTRQENTVIQTCVVATSGIAFSGTYLHLYFLSYTLLSQWCIYHLLN